MSESSTIEESTVEESTVEERLSYLEEQNEGLKRVGMLLVTLVILMGITMAHQSSTTAKALSTDGLIINNAGKPRAALTSMPTGHLGMLFYNYAGKLAPSQYSSIPYLDGFAIYDQSGRPRILIGMDDKDNPILAVISKDGKTEFTAVEPKDPSVAPPPAHIETHSMPKP